MQNAYAYSSTFVVNEHEEVYVIQQVTRSLVYILLSNIKFYDVYMMKE